MSVAVTAWGRWRIAWASESNLEYVAARLRASEIDGIGLSPQHGFDGDSAFLEKLPEFAGIVVTDGGNVRCVGLERFPRLRFLSVGGQRTSGLDLNPFMSLTDLRLSWHRHDKFPCPSVGIESLYLRGYAPAAKNLEELPEYKTLHTIELVQANVLSLAGVQRFKQLVELDVSYCRGLTTVAALQESPVTRLHFEACSRIEDWEVLARCAYLSSIRMSSCGKLRSLSFLNQCASLEEFRSVRTEIIDQDLTPLLRLKSVGFIDKRGYSHTFAQVNAAIGSRRSG